MRLLIVLPFLAVGLASCTNYISSAKAGATDPFFGRTRVMPPATGSAATTDPAYSMRGAMAVTPATTPALAPPALRPVTASATVSNVRVPVSRSNVPLNVASPSNSVAPIASRGAVAPITPIQPVTPQNPVTVNSSTTYTSPHSGNPYASRGNVGFRPGSTRVFSSSSTRPGPGPRITRTRVTPPSLSDHLHKPRAIVAPSSIAPSSTAACNSTPSNVAASSGGTSSGGWRATSQTNRLADNRVCTSSARTVGARTYGQLGQVCLDTNGSASRVSATSSAVANAQPPYRTPTWAASSIQPRRINLPNNVIDIMDLPPKRTGASSIAPSQVPTRAPSRVPNYLPAGASTTVHRDPSVRLASATTIADNPYSRRQPQFDKPANPTSKANTSRYGHAGNHGWLKGRLEYSQAKRLWKLRYIPIDGQTDQFGGSVILRKSSLLSGCERGDFVEVNGRLAENAASTDFAPEYELTQIRRVGK